VFDYFLLGEQAAGVRAAPTIPGVDTDDQSD